MTRAQRIEQLVIPELEEWDVRAQSVRDSFWSKELPSILVIGPSKSGKSTSYFEVCFQLRDQFFAGVVFASSHVPGGAPYSLMYQEVYIYKDVTNEKLMAIDTRQNVIIQRYDKDGTREYFNPQLIVTFDDIINSKTKHIALLTNMFTLWRHIHICVIMLVHGVKFVLPPIRNSVQHVYCRGAANQQEEDALFKSFHANFNNKFLHKVSLDYYTSNFGTLVTKVQEKGLEETNFCFYPPARDTRKLFKMGSSDYWYIGELLYQQKILDIKNSIKVRRVSRKVQSQDSVSHFSYGEPSPLMHTTTITTPTTNKTTNLTVETTTNNTKRKPSLRPTLPLNTLCSEPKIFNFGQKKFEVVPPRVIRGKMRDA